MFEPEELIDVSFDMRNQVKLFVGERSKIQFDSGCNMFDLFIHNPYDFDFISFQNFYTAYLTIKAKEKYPKENSNGWKIILKRYKLMENVHSESGSTNKFQISKDMFLEKDLKKVSQLRFILQQPSMYWKDFGIDDIKLKIKNPDLLFEKTLDEFSKKCENTKKTHFENLPPIDLLSNKLQNLWLICNEASKQTKNDLEDNPYFDIDGCYDVNLLTYNSI